MGKRRRRKNGSKRWRLDRMMVLSPSSVEACGWKDKRFAHVYAH